jgi:16S rRNA (cytidine1402-2'-O)-methyltransferase
MIFHEAPHKLKNTLDDMAASFGADRRISLCRELTKINEEAHRTTLGEAIAYYDNNAPRGEYVLVVEGRPENTAAVDWSGTDIAAHVESYIASGMSKKDAIKAVARDRGVHKSVIYKELL